MSTPRYIEESFPIVQINPLSQRERTAFKPIYKMHKWFARRSSSVFRAILLASALPAHDEDGKPIDIMDEFYKGHADDPRLRRPDGSRLRVLDPFMGGGTTVVEALRLGFEVVGIDYNPIAWFIVKGETTPVNVDELKRAYERVEKKVKKKLLDMYRTRCPVTGEDADIIYAFWVKQGICVNAKCKGVTDLFKSYEVARKRGDATLRYYEVSCPSCKAEFDWEIDRCTITAGGPQVKGAKAAGKKRAVECLYVFGLPHAGVECPGCGTHVALAKLDKKPKAKSKKVSLHVLIDPSTSDFFEVRGELPDEVVAPVSGYRFEPAKGPVAKGKFRCTHCGREQAIVDSADAHGKPLPFRYYGFYAHSPHLDRDHKTKAEAQQMGLPTNNSKWFAAVTKADQSKVEKAYTEFELHRAELPIPDQEIHDGYNTNRLVIHKYRRWSDLYGPRQKLGLGLLLKAIVKESDSVLRDALLGAFQSMLDFNCMLCRFSLKGNKIEGATSSHDYRNPTTIVENNVWGIGAGQGSFGNTFRKVLEGIGYQSRPYLKSGEGAKVFPEDAKSDGWNCKLDLQSACATGLKREEFDYVITDPPYAGSVQYAEMASSYYVWLHHALKDNYSAFEHDLLLRGEEIVENGIDKDSNWFFEQLTEAWRECHRVLKDDGLLVFTFHHREGDRWTGLLKSLFDAGFYLVAAYPTHSEALNSIVIQATSGITYDIIHVCRKRPADLPSIPWSLLRKKVQREARQLLQQIEASRDPLPSPDVWMILLGRALHLFSQHYGQVLDHDGSVLELDEAMARLRVLVREVRGESLPLPGSLEDIDGLTKIYLLHIAGQERGWSRDDLHKELRGYAHSPDDLHRAGLIEHEHKNRKRWRPVAALSRYPALKKSRQVQLINQMHQLLGMADAGENIEPVLRIYSGWSILSEGLRYLGKRDTSLRELCELVCRSIEALGPETKPKKKQLNLFT